MEYQKSSEERRTSDDRRKFAYTAHVPERRSGIDRREMAGQKFKMKVA